MNSGSLALVSQGQTSKHENLYLILKVCENFASSFSVPVTVPFYSCLKRLHSLLDSSRHKQYNHCALSLCDANLSQRFYDRTVFACGISKTGLQSR